MENLENNNEDDANVHGDVAMNNETGDGNANEDEDEDNNTGGQVVEEYVSTLADFKRIDNHYDPFDDDGNFINIRLCLNIVSSTIQNIPDEALQYCGLLTDLRVRQGGQRRIILRTIGKGAFQGTSLRRINQFLKQGGVLRLEGGAFAECDLEGELIIPSSVLWVGERCFNVCTSITSVVFEPSTTGTIVEIDEGAFRSCTELSSATLPTTLERIPWFGFMRCTSLINIPIPPNVVELGQHSFAGCTSLPSMNLPESVDVISKQAFLNCTALTTVTIRTASSDLRFGTDIFGGCTSLSTIRMYPWHWSKLLSAMNEDPTFLFQNFRNYHKTIFEASESIRRRRSIRRIIQENQDLKTRFQPVLQAKQTMIDAQQLEIEELKQQLAAMTMVRKRKKTSK